MTDLTALGMDRGLGINNQGDVVGIRFDDSGVPHAAVWSQADGVREIGPPDQESFAISINDAGQAIGWAHTPNGTRAFVWSEKSGRVDLGGLAGLRWSEPVAISGRGHVVGAYGDSEGQGVFLWTERTGMVEVGDHDQLTYLQATGVNDSGQVIGSVQSEATGDAVTHAFSWTEQSGMTTLFETAYAATDVNNRGAVVGTDGFVWTEADGYTSLGAGYDAVQMNDKGRVVGQSRRGDVTQAFTWTSSGGSVDIPSLPDLSSSIALRVNSSGLVLGNGRSEPDHRLRAFAWSEASGTYELPGLGGGDTGVFALNDRGQALGHSMMPGGRDEHWVLWTIK